MPFPRTWNIISHFLCSWNDIPFTFLLFQFYVNSKLQKDVKASKRTLKLILNVRSNAFYLITFYVYWNILKKNFWYPIHFVDFLGKINLKILLTIFLFQQKYWNKLFSLVTQRRAIQCRFNRNMRSHFLFQKLLSSFKPSVLILHSKTLILNSN